jgi:hypothetical protein
MRKHRVFCKTAIATLITDKRTCKTQGGGGNCPVGIIGKADLSRTLLS